MELPREFIESTRALMGEERFNRYLAAFDEEPPVSIRLNPKSLSPAPSKGRGSSDTTDDSEPPLPLEGVGERLPWCRNAYYLDHRPNFTFDPLFHAGCYYVQEAASMFLDEVLRQLSITHCPLSIDMCAAPGGKSTLLRSALPADSILVSNEPIRQRASILLENVQKWGYENHFVTNLYPRDFRKNLSKFFDKRSGSTGFDLILCDVPCSGEGMFRKDEATIREWSPQNVERCWQLQREIVSDAWACLNDGGLLIYSTCTFNTKENEENVRWMLSQFDAQVLPIETRPEWNIIGSLLDGFIEPVYRFIPGITRSEGLFMCVLRKGGSLPQRTKTPSLRVPSLEPLPLHTDGPRVELTYQQAIAFLRREALVLPSDAPRGIVEVCFMGQPLGMVKNLGTRANNLYPKEWRIKSTYVPSDYEPIVVPMSEKI